LPSTYGYKNGETWTSSNGVRYILNNGHWVRASSVKVPLVMPLGTYSGYVPPPNAVYVDMAVVQDNLTKAAQNALKSLLIARILDKLSGNKITGRGTLVIILYNSYNNTINQVNQNNYHNNEVEKLRNEK